MKTTHSFLPATMRMFAASAISFAAVFTVQADEATITNLDGAAAGITISGDSTLTVPDDGYSCTSLTVSGSGMLMLAGTGRIATSSVTVSSGVALVVNGRLDSTSITVVPGGAVDLVNSRDAHSLSIAGTGIGNSGAVYCSESGITDENNSPFATNITLTADATVKADFAWGIIAQDSDKAYLNLGTNKLTIKGTNSFLIAGTAVYGSGAIEVADGATLKPIKATPNSIFDAACTIKSGGKLDVAMTTTFKNLVCEEGGGISVSSGKNLCIRNQGTMTVHGTADVRGNLYLGTQYTHTANLEVGGVVNVYNDGILGVSGSGYIKQIPGTQGKVNISNSGRVIYEYCDDPWIAEYGDVFAGTGELTFETEEQITHTITNSDFAGVVKFSASTNYDACNILGGSKGAMFSGAPELVTGGKIHLGSWYDAEGNIFRARNLSGGGTFDADREATETPWIHTIETTQPKDSRFYGKFAGSTCKFDLIVKGEEDVHTLTLAGKNTTSGTLTVTNNAKVVFDTSGNWTNGTVVVANGGYLESKNEGTVASALQLQSGSTLKIAAKTANGTTNAIPVAVGALVLPDEGNATIDITDIPAMESGESQLLVACTAITADTDVSHLQVAGKDGYFMKAEAGTGIAIEHVQEALVWSNGSWNVAPEDMQRFGEATIVLSEGENVVELPGDVSFETVSVSADAAARMYFSNCTATVGQLVLGENVTFVNNGFLNSAPVSVATNAVFEIAAPMTWTNTISGAGGVRVSADEVVFNKQNTFTGGLTVAPGGRARSNVGASLGGGGGGGYGGTAMWDSGIRANRFYGNVTVESGGAADMIRNHYLSCYSLFLSGTGINGSGAAFRSGGISDAEQQPHAMAITLVDDATVSANNAWGLVAPSYRATTLNLSEHTLTITGTSNFLLCNTTINGTGTIEIADGATLKTIEKDTTAGSSATCRIKGGGKLFINRSITFSNIVCEAGSTMTFGYNKTLGAAGELVVPSDGYVALDISALPDISVGSTKTLILCSSITTDTDVSHLRVTGKANYVPKAVAEGIAVMRLPDALAWSGGSWNVAPEDMQLFSEASIVLSEGTNEVAIAGVRAFDRVTVSASAPATLLFTDGAATIGELALGANVTYVHTGTVTNDTVAVGAGATIASDCEGSVATNVLSLALGSTIYRGAYPIKARTTAVAGIVRAFRSPRLLGSGNESAIMIRYDALDEPSGLWRITDSVWTEPRPNPDVFIFEPDLPQGTGNSVLADNGLYYARASYTASTGEVSAYESGQDAADAAKGKGGKVSVHASGESINLGAGWFSSGASIVVPAGVIGVTVSAAGVVLGGKDSGDGGSKKYEEEEPARAEVVETGKTYASLALAKSDMGNTPCTFRLLAESADSIHLASASDVSGQTLLLNNFPYAGTVTGAAANLARASSVTAYYAILDDAKGDWTEGDTINLLSDGARYTVGSGKTLVLDGEKTYAVAKPFDLTGTLIVGGCTFTASAGININAGTLKAAKANCSLIGSGTEVTLGQSGVKVDTDGYNAEIAAAITVTAGGNKPVILKAGLADLRLSGGVVGNSVITIQSGCGKVFAPTSSNCEPGDYTQISEQNAEWATFENGIAVARLVKADGSSTAYSSVNTAGAAAQINPTYQYIEILANNQTLRCLPTIGILRIKYNLDDVVLTFSVQSLAPDWTFDEVYGVAFSVFTPVHKATDYVWDGDQDGEWESIGNWKCNLALDYDLPVATRTPDGNDTVIFRTDDMPKAGWSVCIGSSGGECEEIKVEEDARLTLSYDSLGCDITKTGLGAIVVTNAWTSGTPTITVEEDGGTVTIPKSAAYTRGTNTVVVAETDETVTLGFGVPIADPYAAWADKKGIAGEWDEADESGIYNVFRYLFNEPSGDIKIIDISFDAEGDVVITTAPIKNPEGFSVSVVETSDAAGKSVTDERAITSSSNTTTFDKSASPRFYRVKAVRLK